MPQRLLTGAVITTWIGLTIAPLLAAALLLYDSTDSGGSATAVARAADVRPALLGVAAAADQSLRTGDIDSLHAAMAVLSEQRDRLAQAAPAVLGEPAAARAIADLDAAVAELNTAAERYALGQGDIGDGGAGYVAALEVLNGIIEELSTALDASTAARDDNAVRAILYILAGGALALAGITVAVSRSLTVGRRAARSSTRFESFSHDLPGMLIETDGEHRITFASEASSSLLGVVPKQLIGQPLTDFVRELPSELGPPQSDGTRLMRGDAEWRHEDGAMRRLAMVARAIYDEAGVLVATRGIVSDHSVEHEAEQSLRESEERFRVALDTAQNGMMIISPEGQLEFHNQALSALLGYPAEELTQLTIGQIVRQRDLDMVMGIIAARMWSDSAPSRFEVEFVRRDGEFVHVDLSIAAFRENGARVGVLAEVNDLTETRRASETIRRLAEYDALTGLPNRSLFDRHVARAVQSAEIAGTEFAILMIDLDRFKLVNDTLGHPSGDRLLKAVARRLLNHLSSRHTLARFGGDEFLILIEEVRSAELGSVARDVLDALRETFAHDGHELTVNASIGISVYPTHGEDGESLIQKAGAAMYEAKSRGGNGFEVYEPGNDELTQERLALEGEVRRAIERDELEVYYQPQIDLKTGGIVAFEALARWNHPERGLLPPSQFIPVMEANGMIAEADQWVLRTACAQMHEWHEAGLTDARLAVNVSAREFLDTGLAERVRATLEETGFGQTYLDIEVTETTATLNMDASIRSLAELRELGVGAALDDFGIGHSSLGRLRQFPVDTLKIDRSFISTMHESSDDLAIVKGIVALGHALGLKIVAEGVETEEQSRLLAELGCDIAQGYLFSRPVDAAAVEAMLRKGERLAANAA